MMASQLFELQIQIVFHFSGQMSKVFHGHTAQSIEGLANFCVSVADFNKSCSADPAGLPSLNLACNLLSYLGHLPVQMAAAASDDASSPTTLAFVSSIGKSSQDACQRLSDCISARALGWIHAEMQKGIGSDCIAKAVGEAIEKPTATLQGYITTCSMSSEDLKAVDLGSKLTDLVTHLPKYIKVASINKDLMDKISPEKLAETNDFLEQVEQKLEEHIQSLDGSLVQLTKLHDKYKFLGQVGTKTLQ